VQATEIASPNRVSNIGTVFITVIRNRAPQFNSTLYSGAVTRQTADGTVITTFAYYDPDTVVSRHFLFGNIFSPVTCEIQAALPGECMP
jgi:hypothetical protein